MKTKKKTMQDKQKKINRRDFLKGALASSVALTVMKSAEARIREEAKDYVGYLYDATNCKGCKACVNACIEVNVLPKELGINIKKDYTQPKSGSGNDVECLDYEEINSLKKFGDAPDLDGARALTQIKAYIPESYVKEQCMHCLNPSCVSACPVSAMLKEEKTGIVYNDPDKCIGCRACMIACPFDAIRFEWNKTFPKIKKCEMCRDTNLKTNGIPACVDACPNDALVFGKRENLIKEAHRRINKYPDKYIHKVYGEKDGGGTSVLLLAGVEFEKLGLPKNLKDYSPAEDSEYVQTIYKWMLAPIVAYGAITYIVNKNKKKHEEEE